MSSTTARRLSSGLDPGTLLHGRYLHVKSDSLLTWANTGDVYLWLIMADVTKSYCLQKGMVQKLRSACESIAQPKIFGLRRVIEVVEQVPLDRLHERGGWPRCMVRRVYEAQRSAMQPTTGPQCTDFSDSDTSSAGPSDRSHQAIAFGPFPNLLVRHSSLQIEVKRFEQAFDAPAAHRSGMAHLLVYLLAAWELCRTNMGMLCVNGFYQRLLILPHSNGGNEGPRQSGRADGGDAEYVLYLEVHPNSRLLCQRTPAHGGEHDVELPDEYGHAFLINELSPKDSPLARHSDSGSTHSGQDDSGSSATATAESFEDDDDFEDVPEDPYVQEDLEPGSPLRQFWDFVVLALRLAQDRCAKRDGCPGSRVAQQVAPAGGIGSGSLPQTCFWEQDQEDCEDGFLDEERHSDHLFAAVRAAMTRMSMRIKGVTSTEMNGLVEQQYEARPG